MYTYEMIQFIIFPESMTFVMLTNNARKIHDWLRNAEIDTHPIFSIIEGSEST